MWPFDNDSSKKLDKVLTQLQNILNKEVVIMGAIEDLNDAITKIQEDVTVVQNTITELKQTILDLQAALEANDPTALVEAVNNAVTVLNQADVDLDAVTG